ncbi:hypothetical protein RDWZM_008349 [Blomia tropicalis]|uniref:Uncharacterized protein n=1 Tax=Blomia tropicalis TaxID=40697 RepID=A0A9Q0M1L6_BLOTA|nr:hypothetical protein RDWZM_008349 [Blomia tropicalis]
MVPKVVVVVVHHYPIVVSHFLRQKVCIMIIIIILIFNCFFSQIPIATFQHSTRDIVKSSLRPSNIAFKGLRRPVPLDQTVEQQTVEQQQVHQLDEESQSTDEPQQLEQEPFKQELETKYKKNHPKRIGITKWEQRIDEPTNVYKPRINTLKSQVFEIQHHLQQQADEQRKERKPSVHKPPSTQQEQSYQNVRHIPTTFINSDVGWE